MARVKKNGVARTRGRRKNPLASFTPADLSAMREYVTPPSMTKIKSWALRGKGKPSEGTAVLRPLAERLIASGPGRTGKYKIERHHLEDLATFAERHPERLSSTAKKSVGSLLARRMKREWWNVVDRSDNQKLGGFAATYGPPESCPASCAMRGGVPGTPGCDSPAARQCYGGEHNTLQQWISLQRGVTGYPWRTFLRRLRKTPVDTIRVNVIGDLPADPRDPSKMTIDRARTIAMARAASAPRRIRVKIGERVHKGKKIPVWGLTPYRVRPNAFTYTHYEPTHGDNLRTIRAAVNEGLQINLSADSLADADRKVQYGDVAVVVPKAAYKDAKGRTRAVAQGSGRDPLKPSITTPQGREIFWCPEITTSESARRAGTEAVRDYEQRQLGRKATAAEAKMVKADVAARVVKTCATCSPTGPACAWRGRKKIIGFLAHGGHGGAGKFTKRHMEDLLRGPNVHPLDVARIRGAYARAEKIRAAEARRVAREKTKKTGMKHLAVRTNPRGRRRR